MESLDASRKAQRAVALAAVGVALALVSAVGTWIGFRGRDGGQPTSSDLDVAGQQFTELRGRSGSLRLDFDGDGPRISLSDAEGVVRLRAQLVDGTPKLSLTNRRNTTAIEIEVGEEGAAVDLRAGEPTPQLSLRASGAGAWAHFWDGSKDLRMMIGTSANGATSLSLFKSGMEQVDLYCDADEAGVTIRDSDGNTVWERRSRE